MSDKIFLNANESVESVNEEILNEFIESLPNIPLNTYGDGTSASLCKTYAKFTGVKPEEVMTGNGSDEILSLLIGTFISKGDVLYTFKPDFEMYDFFTKFHDGKVEKFEIEPGAPFDVDGFIEKGKQVNPKLIIFSNPQNPTGIQLKEPEIIKILETFKDIPVAVDEAYVEFADYTAVRLIDKYDNLFVSRTLSKAFMLAGARCGFLLANPKSLEKVKLNKPPYNVNLMTQKLAKIVLNKNKQAVEAAKNIKSERERMFNLISEMKFEDLVVYPSNGNFLYFKGEKDKPKIMAKFQEHDIVIRNFANDNFRITVATPDLNNKVLEIIRRFPYEIL